MLTGGVTTEDTAQADLSASEHFNRTCEPGAGAGAERDLQPALSGSQVGRAARVWGTNEKPERMKRGRPGPGVMRCCQRDWLEPLRVRFVSQSKARGFQQGLVQFAFHYVEIFM